MNVQGKQNTLKPRVPLVSAHTPLTTRGLALALALALVKNLRTVLLAFKLNAETRRNRYFCPPCDRSCLEIEPRTHGC